MVKENIPSNTISGYKWWNVLHYDIDITPDYTSKFITGTNTIEFCALQTGKKMQLDLQTPMLITAITWKQLPVAFKKIENAYIITFPQNINEGKTETIKIHFEGHPQTATKPPWDNGWIWTSDKKGRPWMSVACEGRKQAYGSHAKIYNMMSLIMMVCLILHCLIHLQPSLDNKDGRVTYTWKLVNPINNYNIRSACL